MNLGPAGVNHADSDGSNRWEADPRGPHAYLVENIPPTDVAAQIESLMLAAKGSLNT